MSSHSSAGPAPGRTERTTHEYGSEHGQGWTTFAGVMLAVLGMLNVIYGIAGYKVHAKICLVVRRATAGLRRYIHLGTGNYNDGTARVYTDFGLLTSDPVIAADASAFWSALTGYSDPPTLRKLVMAPTALRGRLRALIEREQRRAEAGQPAVIVSVPSSKRHATRDPSRCTPPTHRSMPLTATWSARPASTRVPSSVSRSTDSGRGRPVITAATAVSANSNRTIRDSRVSSAG